MRAETVAEMEQQAGDQAHRLLDLIESGRRDELVVHLNRLDHAELCCVVLAVAQALIEQEAANSEVESRCRVLAAQNRTLEAGNSKLFAERRALQEKLDEWRGIAIARKARAA